MHGNGVGFRQVTVRIWLRRYLGGVRIKGESLVRTDEPALLLRSLRHGVVQKLQLAGALCWGALHGATQQSARDRTHRDATG